ncbi:DUF2079 domain-containing protein [Myxococcota bacterium]|nr:DUF2079 domain-containing protein [Myxococcota bacterium]
MASADRVEPPAAARANGEAGRRGGWIAAAAVLAGVAVHAVLLGAVALDCHLDIYPSHRGNPADEAYFLQRIWQVAFGAPATRTLLWNEVGSGLVRGLHFEPGLALYVPLVRLWPDVGTLVLGQALLISLGALPAYAIGRRLAGDRAAAVLLAWAWLAAAAGWRMGSGEFRPFVSSVPFMAGALAAALAGRAGWAFALALAAASFREEVAFFVLAAVPAVAWAGRGEGRGRTAWWALAGAALAWIAVLRAFHGGATRFVDLAGMPRAVIENLLHPVPIDPTSPSPQDPSWSEIGTYLWTTLGPGAALAPLAPLWALGMAFQAVAYKVSFAALAGLPRLHSYQYLAPVLAVLPALQAAALGRLSRWGARAAVRVWRGLEEAPVRAWVARAGAAAILAAQVAAFRAEPPLHWGPAIAWLRGQRVVSAGHEPPWPLLRRIPAAEPVLASTTLSRLVAARPVVYSTADWRTPEERARVVGAVAWAAMLESESWEEDLRAAGFEAVGQAGGVRVFHRPSGPPRPSPPLTPGAPLPP